MSAEEPTIPEEPVAEPAQPAEPAATEPAQPAAAEPSEPPKRGRGRPAGSKDKTPRVTKPKVRVEPLQPPEPPAAKKKGISEIPAGDLPEKSPPVVEEAPPSPEPPSPRTLYRQTSAHLLTLRDLVQTQQRASVAERYTSRLHAWPVV